MSNVFSRVKDKVEEAISPRVVQPSQVSTSRSWESSSGVIRTSELTRESLPPARQTVLSLFCSLIDEIRNCFSITGVSD